MTPTAALADAISESISENRTVTLEVPDVAVCYSHLAARHDLDSEDQTEPGGAPILRVWSTSGPEWTLRLVQEAR